MHRVSNYGIGMVVIVSPENADKAISRLNASGETAYLIGRIRQKVGNEPQTIVE